MALRAVEQEKLASEVADVKAALAELRQGRVEEEGMGSGGAADGSWLCALCTVPNKPGASSCSFCLSAPVVVGGGAAAAAAPPEPAVAAARKVEPPQSSPPRASAAPPPSFMCPLTLALFEDPVLVAGSGQT